MKQVQKYSKGIIVAGVVRASLISHRRVPCLHVPAGDTCEYFWRPFWLRQLARGSGTRTCQGPLSRGSCPDQDWWSWWVNLLDPLFLGWHNSAIVCTVSQSWPVGLGCSSLRVPSEGIFYQLPCILCLVSPSHTGASWDRFPIKNICIHIFVQDLLLTEFNLIHNPSSGSWNFNITVRMGDLLKFH